MQKITNEAANKRFKSIFEIGSGGFGSVDKVYDNARKDLCAIKKIPNSQSSDQLLREITFLQKLKHQNIITFNEAFNVNDDLWISMEYCPYGCIANYKDIMTETLVLCIIRDVANALQYLHSNDIIHSDVKPTNILFSSTCEIKVADFGVSHYAHSISVLQTGEKDGSPLYMAPEMIKGKPIGIPVDIWALGITAFEMLVGIPFGLTGCKDFTEWLKSNNPKWSDELKQLLCTMLSIDPSQRPSASSILSTPLLKNLQQTWLIASPILNTKTLNNIIQSDDE